MKNTIKIEQVKQINPGIGGSTKMNPVGAGAEIEVDGNEESIDSPVKSKKMRINTYVTQLQEVPMDSKKVTILKLNHKIQSPNNRKIEFFKMTNFDNQSSSGTKTLNQRRSSIQKNLGYLLNSRQKNPMKKKPPVGQRQVDGEEMQTVKNFDTVMSSRKLLKEQNSYRNTLQTETIKEALDEDTEQVPSMDQTFSRTQNIQNSQKDLKRFKLARGSSTLSGTAALTLHEILTKNRVQTSTSFGNKTPIPQKQEKFMSASASQSKSSQLIKFKKIRLSYEANSKIDQTPPEDCIIDPDSVNDTPLAGPLSMVASQTFLQNSGNPHQKHMNLHNDSIQHALEQQGVSKFRINIPKKFTGNKNMTPQIVQKYQTIQDEPHVETQFLSKLEKSKKLQFKIPIAHSFSIIGVDPKEPEKGPKLLDYYPDIKENPSEYMYIHSLQSICFQGNKRIIEYTLTQCTGDKKYLTSLVYPDPDQEQQKAIVLVSETPMFSTQRQLLEVIYERVIRHSGPIEPENTLEFWLSLVFHHFKLDASNLQFQLVTNGSCILKYENNISQKCFKLENFNFRDLFHRIKPSFFVEIFICILHERKIILVNQDESTNATLIQTLLTLLYPLSWPCSMVSFLNPDLIDYLDAPFPFLVGVSKKLWNEIYTQRWERMDEDIVVFDLQNQSIMNKQELPSKPQPYVSFMIQKLENYVLKINDKQDHLQQCKFNLRIKQLFLNFLLYLINDFEDFYIKQKTPLGKNATAHEIFDFRKYTRSENQKAFRERFVESQAFIHFIEEAYHMEKGNIEKIESIKFFKKQLENLRKKGNNIKNMRQLQDQKIDKFLFNYQTHQVIYTLSQCVEKYKKSVDKSDTQALRIINYQKIVQMQPYDTLQILKMNNQMSHNSFLSTSPSMLMPAKHSSRQLQTKRITNRYEMSINQNKFQEVTLSQKMQSINHMPQMKQTQKILHDPSEISDSASDHYVGGQEATPQVQNSTRLMKKTSSLEQQNSAFGWSDFVAQVKNSIFGTEEESQRRKTVDDIPIRTPHRESIVQEIDSSDDEGINQQMIHRAIRPKPQSPGSPFRVESTEEQATVKVINYPTFQKSASIAPVQPNKTQLKRGIRSLTNYSASVTGDR